MKYSILCFFILCILSCKQNQPSKDTATPFNYLVGDWERTNDKEGMTTLEHWRVVNTDLLEGHAYTLYEKDTIFNERMELSKGKESWLLKITEGDDKPVTFKVTSQEQNSFMAVNPDNEFPKKINYSYFDNVLSAKIAADSNEVSFIFWRVEE